MSDWITQERFILNEETLKAKYVQIETSKYVCSMKCSEPTCNVIIVWNSAGGDEEDLEFRVKDCTCGEEDYYTLCCRAHKNTFVCPKCQ